MHFVISIVNLLFLVVFQLRSTEFEELCRQVFGFDFITLIRFCCLIVFVFQ